MRCGVARGGATDLVRERASFMPVYNHTGLVVSDLERSKRFYKQVLGFRLWYEDSPADGAVAKLLGMTPPLGASVRLLR